MRLHVAANVSNCITFSSSYVVPQQGNQIDCGVYTCFFGATIASDPSCLKAVKISPDQVKISPDQTDKRESWILDVAFDNNLCVKMRSELSGWVTSISNLYSNFKRRDERRTLVYCGLENIGKSSYASALVQTLFSFPDFISLLSTSVMQEAKGKKTNRYMMP